VEVGPLVDLVVEVEVEVEVVEVCVGSRGLRGFLGALGFPRGGSGSAGSLGFFGLLGLCGSGTSVHPAGNPMSASTQSGLSAPPSIFARVSRLGVPALGRRFSPWTPLIPFCEEPYVAAVGVGHLSLVLGCAVVVVPHMLVCVGTTGPAAGVVGAVGEAAAAAGEVGVGSDADALDASPGPGAVAAVPRRRRAAGRASRGSSALPSASSTASSSVVPSWLSHSSVRAVDRRDPFASVVTGVGQSAVVGARCSSTRSSTTAWPRLRVCPGFSGVATSPRLQSLATGVGQSATAVVSAGPFPAPRRPCPAPFWSLAVGVGQSASCSVCSRTCSPSEGPPCARAPRIAFSASCAFGVGQSASTAVLSRWWVSGTRSPAAHRSAISWLPDLPASSTVGVGQSAVAFSSSAAIATLAFSGGLRRRRCDSCPSFSESCVVGVGQFASWYAGRRGSLPAYIACTTSPIVSIEEVGVGQVCSSPPRCATGSADDVVDPDADEEDALPAMGCSRVGSSYARPPHAIPCFGHFGSRRAVGVGEDGAEGSRELVGSAGSLSVVHGKET